MTNSMAIKKKDNIFKRALAHIVFMWRNKRHFKMQTFGMSVFACVAIFVFNILSINIDYNNMIATSRANTTVFSQEFPMSLTGDTFSVSGAYVDSTKTKAFVFLKNSANMSKIPVDAAAYRVLVLNEDYSELKEHVHGSIHILGSTGYMGIYIESDIPFVNNIKHIIIRCLKATTSNKSPYVYYDEYDAAYNQGHLFLNLGSYTAKTATFLEKHDSSQAFDFKLVYREVMLQGEDQKYRELCEKAYSDMEDARFRISDFYSRIRETYPDIDMPTLPYYLAGDKFENVPYTYDSDGNVTSSYKKYIPYTLFPGGIEFDWYRGNITDGYYKLVPNTGGLSLKDYLAAIPSGEVNLKYRPDIYYKNGTKVSYLDDKASSMLEQSIARDVSAYCEAVTDYLKAKYNYQTVYLPSFLILELNSLSADTLLSSYGEADAVF